jgi:hypothetical protein
MQLCGVCIYTGTKPAWERLFLGSKDCMMDWADIESDCVTGTKMAVVGW